MTREMAAESPPFVSTAGASPGERRLALAVVLASAAVFLALAPFARVPLRPVWAFIPIYESALVVNDLITATFLFSQFSVLRSRALRILAAGYLFTAGMTIAHALTFPGLFSPTGLLGAGPQSTAWLYMFWHGGFPLFVIAYTRVPPDGPAATPGRPGGGRFATLAGGAAVLGLVGGLTLLATYGHGVLPAIMRGQHYTSVMILVVSSTWALTLLALLTLWRRRARTVLDLWLMVVLCAWLFDIALAAVLNAGRFDLGFYAGRIYGLLAASFVLVVLLIESGQLHARLRQLYLEREEQNRCLEATVRERTEQLLQSEKVATMGALVAGIAHELNNPLAVVMGQAQLLQQGAPDSAAAARAEKIVTAAGRCVRIVRNFLALARKRPPERTAVHVNQVIAEALELLAYDLRTSGIDVTTLLADDLPIVSADAHQLHQVVVNLVANAQHAMRPADGLKRIAVTSRFDPARAQICVDVADTGPGIAPELRERVFEPFFTTKPLGQGTGLGLSLCRGIVEQHGGTLGLTSAPGAGATFRIELPAIALEAASAAAVPAEPASLPGKTILVVDDEEEIAALVAEVLRRDGHTVQVASNGRVALDLVAHRPYDLILSDSKMPGCDGPTLHREITRRAPALGRRIIFVTGDVLDADKQRMLTEIGAPIITKPFNVNDVRAAVNRLLAEADAEARPQRILA